MVSKTNRCLYYYLMNDLVYYETWGSNGNCKGELKVFLIKSGIVLDGKGVYPYNISCQMFII